MCIVGGKREKKRGVRGARCGIDVLPFVNCSCVSQFKTEFKGYKKEIVD